MLYQRRSTTYELMNLDETTGSGGAASSGGTSNAARGSQRRSDASTNAATAAASQPSTSQQPTRDQPRRRQPRRLREHGGRRPRPDADRAEHDNEEEEEDSSLLLASRDDDNDAETYNNDPTTTTTISEMIVDGYGNELDDDEDSLVIFRKKSQINNNGGSNNNNNNASSNYYGSVGVGYYYGNSPRRKRNGLPYHHNQHPHRHRQRRRRKNETVVVERSADGAEMVTVRSGDYNDEYEDETLDATMDDECGDGGLVTLDDDDEFDDDVGPLDVDDDEKEEEKEEEGSERHRSGRLRRYRPEELEELEQYEMDDRLGEMIPAPALAAFGRRSRREGVFGRAVLSGSSVGSGSSWDATRAGEFLLPGQLEQQLDIPLSDSDSKSTDEDDDEYDGRRSFKKYLKLILPHVALVAITCAYTLMGASIFYSVENPNEIATKRKQLNMIYERETQFVTALVRLARRAHNHNTNNGTGTAITTRDTWAALARRHMHEMSDQLFVAFDKYFLTAHEVKHNATKEIWTFSTALFFSVTVVTTIGYGNPVPVTQFGRMMCISFSLLGIPLTLVTIADMGKFLSERLIWAYSAYVRLKMFLCERVVAAQHRHGERWTRRFAAAIAAAAIAVNQSKNANKERVCEDCQSRGLSEHMQLLEEQRIPALLVFGILVLYTALGGVLMSNLEEWNFFTSFYWSFITMTTVGFGDLMPRRDQYMYFILLYIILGLAITTMCIDLVGVQYIRKIHYFGRKIQDARSALAVVGGKVVLVSELYANLMQKRARQSAARDAFIIENLYVSKHIIPFIPSDIRYIRYIDQSEHHHHHNRGRRRSGRGGSGGKSQRRDGHRTSRTARGSMGGGGGGGAATVSFASIVSHTPDASTSPSPSTSSTLSDADSVELSSSCRFCHSRFSISNHVSR